MARGWIKLWRRALDSEVWSHGVVASGLFVNLLLRANHSPSNFRGVHIARGEVVFSVRNLALDCRISVKQVRVALSQLERSGAIELRNEGNRFTRATICNYDIYQSCGVDEGASGANERHAKGKEEASEGHYLKNKEERSNKKKLGKAPNGMDAEFEAIWAEYPEKQGKANARKEYLKARREGVSEATIRAGLAKYIHHVEAQREAGFPELRWRYGGTWFKQYGWDDSYEVEVHETKKRNRDADSYDWDRPRKRLTE